VSDELVELIRGALRERDEGVENGGEVGKETPLFGRDGILDSMGLVTLVVALEQAIEEQFGVSVSLADERALSERKSPFRTVGALAEYAGRLIGQGTGAWTAPSR
jgi:acyl carrier protein